MKKLSRKNKLGIEQSMAEERQRYSFRKLNSGILVSAAIGAFLFFGAGTAQAATPDSAQSNSNSATLAPTDAMQQSPQNNSQQKQVTLPSAGQNTAKQNLSTTPVANTSSNDTQKVNTEVPEPVSNNNLQNSESKQLATKFAAATTNMAATPTADTPKATLSTGTSITINQSTIGAINGSGDLVITLNVPNYQAGTKVTLAVPNGYYYGPDGSQNLPTGTGTTIINPSLTTNPGPWTITNTYTSASNGGGGTTQSFVFKRYNNYIGQTTIPMNQIGLVDKIVTLTQTDPGQKSESIPLTFQQYTMPQMDPSMKLSRPIGTSMTTPLTPNTTYMYEVDVNETTGVDYGLSDASKQVNNAVNSGTTITIPVPEGFLLNQSLTSQLNGFTDQTTISQSDGAGSDIIINVPKGSGSQNYENKLGYQLAGQYNLPTPQTDTTYTAKGQITVDQQVQYADGTMHQLTGTIAPWSVVIQGDSTIPSKVPALDINGIGYSGKGTGTLRTNADPTKPLLTFDIDNPSVLNVTNGQVIFTIPDGLGINKITTPVSATNLPGTTSYQWQATLTNGRTVSGTANAGDAITTDSAIKTLIINPNLLEPGATTIGNSFKFYGTVDKTLANGTTLTATGKTQYAVLGTTYFKTVEVSQTISQATAGENTFFWKNQTLPGSQAGYMSVFSTFGDPNSNQIYEPIFYYVIPEGFSYNMAKGLVNPNGTQPGNISSNPITPKVSTFEVNSQEVVKLDYTGTGYNFMTGGNSNNQVYLNISSLATPGTNYRAAIYVVSPTTKMTNQAATTDPNFNPAYTQGQTADAYLVGSGNYTVSTAQVVSVGSAAQGNLNAVPEIKGSSDDKGSPAMSFQTRVQNASNTAMNDGTLVINVDQGGTDFQLTGSITGLSADTTVTYSTTAQKAPSSMTGAQPDLTSYVSADQVKDWSAIKSIAIHLGTIAANNYSPIITLNGTDPTVTQDAGKTVGIVTQMYTTNLAPLIGKTTDNAQIAVSGKSTVTSQYSYVDDQGKTQIIAIPDLSYTYNDNKDTALTVTQAKSNLTAADKALIPAGYVLGSVQLLPPATKSWQTDAPIGTPEFGQKVQYFYNNAVVQYNLVKVYSTDAQTKDVTRTIDYIDQTTGQTMPNSLAKTVTQTATVTQYEVKDSTGKVIGYNTTGTWANGVYTPSKDANGQIKVDTTDANASWLANGSKWDQVTNPNLSSHGYNGPFTDDSKTANPSVAENIKPTADETVKVYYTENIVEVSKPVTTTDTIPGTDTHFAQNITDSDLSRTITRTINVYDQTGKLVNIVPQTVTFTRSAQVNAVTGAITRYTDWSSTNSNFDAYKPTVTADQGIQSITDSKGSDYTNVLKDTNGKVAGVGEVAVPNTDTSANDETVNIYLNQAKTFTGTETITYNTYDKDGKLVGTPTTETHNSTVSGTEYYNPATGKVEYTFDNPTATYQSVNVAPKTGYYASTNTIPEVSKTITNANPQDSDLDNIATVDYKPMGQVIQVDQNGYQIPGTTPVTYNNDPGVPTKAGATTIPDAPTGWVPVTPVQTSVTPTDPGTDTKVVYEPLNTVVPNIETVTRTINYVDKTTGQPMPSSVAPAVTQNVTLTQYEVKDSTGKVIGYNTTGTWTNGVYTPSKEANGQIKVDTTNAADSWMNSDGSKWDQVTNPDLSSQGYVGPTDNSDTSDPTIAEVTPTTSTKNTTETVYYTEKTVTVTSDEPKTQSDTIDGTNVKYPTGVGETDLNKTITRTVTIVNPDGTKTTTPQTFKFTRSATVNAVTGKVTYGSWNETSHNFDSVTVPTITGYTPSRDVPVITVTPDSKDSDVIITYAANDQSATITYIDDSTGKTITSESASGKFGQPISFTTSSTDEIKTLVGEGYELVSNNFTGQNYQADNANNNFEVHLKHNLTSSTNHKTVSRTVTIYMPDGSMRSLGTQDAKFTQNVTTDDVTHEVTTGDWIPDGNVNWDAVDMPNLPGYTVDNIVGDIKPMIATPDTGDITVKIYLAKAVTYKGIETITFNTHDQDGNVTTTTDTSHHVTVSGTETFDPTTNKTVYTFNTPSGTYSSVKVPVKDGYYASTSQVPEVSKTINSADPQNSDLNTSAIVDYYPMGHVIQVDQDGNPIPGTTPITYAPDPNDPTKAGETTVTTPTDWVPVKPNQTSVTPTNPGENTTITYKHGTKPEAPETKTVTRTINVTDPVTGKVTTTTQTANFTRTVTKDLVTGNLTYGAWNTDQKWNSFTTPTIAGYTPSQTTVAETPVTANDTNQTVNIDYTADKQTTTIQYVDDDEDGKQVGDIVTLTGTTGEKVNTNITVPNNYELATNPRDLPKTITFTANGYPKIVVHLIHKTETVTQSQEITQTIYYVMNDKTEASADNVQTLTVTRTGIKDLVTGQINWTSSPSQTFNDVTSPTIPGYIPDQIIVKGFTVSYGDVNVEVRVIYIPVSSNPGENGHGHEGETTPNKPGQKPVVPTTPNKPSQKPNLFNGSNITNSSSNDKLANKANVSNAKAGNQSMKASANKAKNATLPQTGQKQIASGLLGLLLAGVGLAGLFIDRKRKDINR